MKVSVQLQIALAATVLGGCATADPKPETLTLQPFEDTYRWHGYHLTRETPTSPDGDFQFVGVLSNGDVELIYRPTGSRLTVKANASVAERARSSMPMRIIKSDFKAQAADFERLTTN